VTDELHDYYKKEIQKKDDADRRATLIGMEQRINQLRDAQKETAHYKKQFEDAMSLVETQKLSIKLLQDELGEEAEFDAEETAQMRSVRRECETRVNNYEDRMAQLQSNMQKEIDKQVYLLKKVTKERDDARSEANESQQSARSLFNEQKRLEKSEDRMKDEVSRSNKAVDKMREGQ
jgi:chromosome segregation ATPase